jgi:sugar/nucleoside kinase (ribokinase family)
VLGRVVNHAVRNKIKVAFNPGSKELNLGLAKLRPVIQKVDVLFLNQEEAAKLTQMEFRNLAGMLKKLFKVIGEGIAVVTRGSKGLVVFDGKKTCEAGILPGRVVERTGAGDAFGSGFVSGLILKDNIEYAIQLGSANATSVIKLIGAKNGLLKKGDLRRIKKVRVRIKN